MAINFLNSDFAWLKSSGLELNFLNFAVESFLGGRSGNAEEAGQAGGGAEDGAGDGMG